MQRYLRRAIQPHIDNARSGAGGGVADHLVMPPGPARESTRTVRIGQYRYASRQADLATMGMATQIEVYAMVMGLGQ